jgi:hypothetical protein
MARLPPDIRKGRVKRALRGWSMLGRGHATEADMEAGTAGWARRGSGVAEVAMDRPRREGASCELRPAPEAAALPRRPDGGIDTGRFEARAQRMRRASLRARVAWLLSALR